MSNGTATFKDKDQSIYEFYKTLQEEFLICELRKKIYPRGKDKRYYGKTSEFKKSKIEDIADRNGLPSIFNSEECRREVNKTVFGEFGLPKFMYRDSVERDELKPKDAYYYYAVGAEVRVKREDSIKIGVITKGIDAEWDYVDGSQYKQLIIKNSEVVFVKFKGEEKETMVMTTLVSRVL